MALIVILLGLLFVCDKFSSSLELIETANAQNFTFPTASSEFRFLNAVDVIKRKCQNVSESDHMANAELNCGLRREEDECLEMTLYANDTHRKNDTILIQKLSMVKN